MIPFYLTLLLFCVEQVFANKHKLAKRERPLMINLINTERVANNLPFLCQDSLLSSAAQQHANDMARLDFLGTDLPCQGDAIPPQYCTTTGRLSRLNSSIENVISVYGNSSAEMAMLQIKQSPVLSSKLTNPDVKYVGVGIAYNNQSNNYYWSQVFSTGDFPEVNCTMTPLIETINAQNISVRYKQPAMGLNFTLYPAADLKDLKCELQQANLTEMIQAAQEQLASKKNSCSIKKENEKVAGFLINIVNNLSANGTTNGTLPVNHINPSLLDQLRLNTTLKAILKAIANDTSLQAGLNGTSQAAYDQLYSQLLLNPKLIETNK